MLPSEFKDNDGYSYHFDKDCQPKDKKYFIQLYPNVNEFMTTKPRCTSCDNTVVLSRKQQKPYTHSLLNVTQCKKCYDFYNSGEFEQDDEGYDVFCRWCGEGGTLFSCTPCKKSFCKKCIIRNFSEPMVKTIEEADEWTCFACDEESLRRFRALHWVLMNSIKKKEQNFNTSVIPTPPASETSTLSNTANSSSNSSIQTREQRSRARLDSQVERSAKASVPSTARKYPSKSSKNRFSPFKALPPSTYSFTTQGDQVMVTVTKYPETPQGIEKKNLEQKMTDTLELSQLLKNKIKSMSNTSAFKHAQSDSQIKEELQRVDLIVDFFIEKAQTLKTKMASNIKTLNERSKRISEEDDDNPIIQEKSQELIDISSDDED